jgi:hypothetical protein
MSVPSKESVGFKQSDLPPIDHYQIQPVLTKDEALTKPINISGGRKLQHVASQPALLGTVGMLRSPMNKLGTKGQQKGG